MERISESDIVSEEIIYNQAGRVQVFRVKHIRTGRILCMKKLFVNSILEATHIQSECLAMAVLQHEHIVPLIAASICGQEKVITHILIFSEYCHQGDLDKLIIRLSQSRQYLNENQILEYLRQLVSAFIFMEDKGVAHRDIKPQNIFLSDDNSKLKVGDLGSVLKQDKSSSHELVGTPLYLSPALRRPFLQNMAFGGVVHDVFKSDVFSLGLTFLYLTSLVPVTDLNVIDGLERKISERINQIRSIYPRVCDILEGMLVVDEHFRWSFRGIMDALDKSNRVVDRLVSENVGRMIARRGNVQVFREKCCICRIDKDENELLVFNAGLICVGCHNQYLAKINTNLLIHKGHYINQSNGCYCANFCKYCHCHHTEHLSCYKNIVNLLVTMKNTDNKDQFYNCISYTVCPECNDNKTLLKFSHNTLYGCCDREEHYYCYVCLKTYNEDTHDVCRIVFVGFPRQS